jgi:hypothetical protein
MPRKQKLYHFIYKTTCKLNGNYYYGMHSTDNLEDGYLGSGTRISRSIKKYGVDSHSIERLEFFETREKLREREKEIINEELLLDPLCMNLQLGGGGGFSSEEHRIKNLKAWSSSGRTNYLKKLKTNPEFYERFCNARKKQWENEEYRNKIVPILKNNWIGKSHSEETKLKMSLSQQGKQRGERNSQYGTCWITNGKENKKIHCGDDIPNGYRLGRKI